MPPLYFAPPARPDPFAYANSDAAGSLIQRLIEGASKGRKKKYEDTLIGQIMSGASQDELQTSITGGQGAEQPGFFGRVKEMFSPNAPYRGGVSESPIAQLIMSGKLRELNRDPVETEYMKARTETERARGEYYKAGGSRTSLTVKPWSTLDQERMQGIVNQNIEAVETLGYGDQNFSQANLLKAWENLKIDAEYDLLSPSKQQSLWRKFNSKIQQRAVETDRRWLGGDEYEWNPQSPEVLAAAPQAGGSPFKEYPDAFQEGGVWKVMRGGKKYRIEE